MTEEADKTCQPFSACPWREKLPVCKSGCAEQKERAPKPYEKQQGTDSGKLDKHQTLVLLCCPVIMCHYWCYFGGKELLCSSVDRCARQLIAEYSSGSRAYGSREPAQIWLLLSRATTKCTGCPQRSVITRSALTKALFLPTALPVTFKIPRLVSWLVFWKSFLLLSEEGHQGKGMWQLNLWLWEQRKGL